MCVYVCININTYIQQSIKREVINLEESKEGGLGGGKRREK